MPIRTPSPAYQAQTGSWRRDQLRLLRLLETWDELHKWMRWAENRDEFTAESMEIRNRHVMASFILREGIELIGIEAGTGTAVIWCGLHDIDWQAHQCDTGYWVRKRGPRPRVRNRGSLNALVRYKLSGRSECGESVSRTPGGNEASRRIAERLGFSFEGIQRGANILPGGKFADRYCYARFDIAGLPDLEVQWLGESES